MAVLSARVRGCEASCQLANFCYFLRNITAREQFIYNSAYHGYMHFKNQVVKKKVAFLVLGASTAIWGYHFTHHVVNLPENVWKRPAKYSTNVNPGDLSCGCGKQAE